jgi:uncharacterized protein YwlG (UPF0340 family)
MASKRDKERDISTPSVNWLEQLASEINVPFAPEGWHTMVQICEKLNRDHHAVRLILKKRNAEMKSFRTKTAAGKTITTPHYKL